MPEHRWIAEVVADLGIIAEWNRLVGREDEPLLVEDYSITGPKHVRDARGRVMRVVTRDVLPPVVQTRSPPAQDSTATTVSNSPIRRRPPFTAIPVYESDASS